jgi:hypothetical protein
MRRYQLQFQESDGSIGSEVLYFKGDDAGLVDPDGVPLSTTESFVMHGRTWQIADVHVTQDRIRILCVLASRRSEEDVAPYASARRARL